MNGRPGIYNSGMDGRLLEALRNVRTMPTLDTRSSCWAEGVAAAGGDEARWLLYVVCPDLVDVLEQSVCLQNECEDTNHEVH